MTRDYSLGDIVRGDKSIDIYLGETYSLFDFSYSLASNERDHIVHITKLEHPQRKYAYQYIGEDTLTIKNGWINIRDSKVQRDVVGFERLEEDPSDIIRTYLENQLASFVRKGIYQLAADNIIRLYQYGDLNTDADDRIVSLERYLDEMKKFIGVWKVVINE